MDSAGKRKVGEMHTCTAQNDIRLCVYVSNKCQHIRSYCIHVQTVGKNVHMVIDALLRTLHLNAMYVVVHLVNTIV